MFRRKKVLTIIVTLIFAMGIFLSVPISAYAADPAIEVYGGGGGGGGGSASANSEGGPGGLGMSGGPGGLGGSPAVNGTNGTGGGTGFAGNGGDGGGPNGSSGLPGDNFFNGSGGNGGDGENTTIINDPTAAPASITIIAGDGGAGGIGDTGTSNGWGGNGGSGGSAILTLTAASVTTGAVLIQSGSIGSFTLAGNQKGSDGAGGTAGLTVNTLAANSITATKNDGNLSVNIGNLDVRTATTITIDGTAATDFVIGYVNIYPGGSLTITNNTSGGGQVFTIGTLNIAGGGTATGTGSAVVGSTNDSWIPPGAPSITTTSLPNGTLDERYSQALAATGYTPITWSIDSGSLPAGLSLSGDTISGTPTAAGKSTFTVKAANSEGADTIQLSIDIGLKFTNTTPKIDLTADAVFEINGNYADLLGIKINNTDLIMTPDPGGNFLLLSGWQGYSGTLGKAEEGSVKITLYKEFLATLPNGSYTLTVSFRGVTVSPYTVFDIARSQVNTGSNPPTGDDNDPLAWWIAIFGSSIGLLGILVRIRWQLYIGRF